MQSVSGNLGSSIVCGRAGTFSHDEIENAKKISALRECIFSDSSVTQELREIFNEAHPVEYRKEVKKVRESLVEIAAEMLLLLDRGKIDPSAIEEALGSGGVIHQLLSQLRYLGDAWFLYVFYKKSGLPCSDLIRTAIEEYEAGYTGAIPIITYLAVYKTFGNEACLHYAEEGVKGRLSRLKKFSDLGDEEAMDRLVHSYRSNCLGGPGGEYLDLSREEVMQGLESLAERGNMLALQTLGVILCKGLETRYPEARWIPLPQESKECVTFPPAESIEGKWFPPVEERRRLLALIREKEREEDPFPVIDVALRVGRIGNMSLGMNLEDRLIELHARASCQNTKAISILHEAYQEGSLGGDKIDMSSTVREEVAKSLLLSDEKLLCSSLKAKEDKAELYRKVATGSAPAAEELAFLCAGKLIDRMFQKLIEGKCRRGPAAGEEELIELLLDLAERGSVRARNFLLQEIDTIKPDSFWKTKDLSNDKLLSWAIAGSAKAATLYLRRIPMWFERPYRILFALIDSVKTTEE